MKKFRLDLISVLLVVLIPGLVIWFKGELVGVNTPDQRANAILILCVVLLLGFLAFSFEDTSRLSVARKRFARFILGRSGTPASGPGQGLPLPKRSEWLELADVLKGTHGLRWRYRQSWLLVTGDESAIVRALPDLADNGWLVTQDAVLLWKKTGVEGRPDPD